ncbi:MAG: Cobalamin biosynthesis protein [Verrucomicrobiales bacterium]|nr:Cobalamin biosynthesis protein [Verrucomicrobiales bacterium]
MALTSQSPRARYIMIGGFLGAGKTTAVAALAQHLTDSGHKVGLITNDQGRELVDTAMLRSLGFATEEIPGGCFCCRFNSLTEAAASLTEANRPDVIIAEPVGSCTDLVATVTYPLRRIYGDSYQIAPLSVLVDPIRAMRVLGLAEGGNFSSKVVYIYRKQLEEADLIIVGKSELLTKEETELLTSTLEREFPSAEVMSVSVREEWNLESWFERVTTGEQVPRAAMPVDYDVYAEGEALLGWFNATVAVSAEEEFEVGVLLRDLCAAVQRGLEKIPAEVAHLKMTYSPDESLGGDVAVVNLVRNDLVPELGISLDEPSESGQLIINLRAEADPSALAEAVRQALLETAAARPGLELLLEHHEHFRPGRPEPTHRDA